MPARTFEDSAGAVWEVFEVHRASQKPGAVSAGLENGWLAFVSEQEKRRLAPFPTEWVDATSTELERLCRLARFAPAPRVAAREMMRPKIRSRADEETPTPAKLVMRAEESRLHREADPDEAPIAMTSDDDSVEHAVRAFAHAARARGLPAIEAMVELKGLLSRRFTDTASPARDRRLVRRWFVETYYFERNV